MKIYIILVLIAGILASGCIDQPQKPRSAEQTNINEGNQLILLKYDVALISETDGRQPGWYTPPTKERTTGFFDGEMGMVVRMMTVDVVTGSDTVLLNINPLGESLKYWYPLTETTLEPWKVYRVTITYNTPESGKYSYLFNNKNSPNGRYQFELTLGEKPTGFII